MSLYRVHSLFGHTKAFVLSRIRLRKLACTRYRDTTRQADHQINPAEEDGRGRKASPAEDTGRQKRGAVGPSIAGETRGPLRARAARGQSRENRPLEFPLDSA